MPRYIPKNPHPVRHDLSDPRSSRPSAAAPGKPLLNDRRSTRGRRT